MKLSILITGASSSLMSQFIDIIEFEKYDVFAITRNRESITHENVHVFEGDVCDWDFVNEAVKNIHTIVHAAAVTHAFHKQEYNNVNVKGTQHLVDASKFNGVKRFVFVSSRAAGVDSGTYGLSKYLGEKYVQNNISNWMIFRPAEIYGGSKNEGIDKLIHEVLTKKILLCPAQVKNRLYPVFIDDVVGIMYDLIFKKKYTNKIVTINGREGYSYIELAKCISQILSKRRMIIPVPKMIMELMRMIIRLTHLKMGLVPDQIPRLYSRKEIENVDREMLDIGSYLIKKYGNIQK